jgi:hypothetical protein
VEHGASENPPVDVTLREYYGVRPSVAAYVLNSPDEIQGDLFSYVSKHPKVSMSQVSALAHDMMQSYMEVASSRGLASERQLGTGIKSYLKFGDGWEVVELTTPKVRSEFERALCGDGCGTMHALSRSKFTVFGLMDDAGSPRTYIEVNRTKGADMPPYFVTRIGYKEQFLPDFEFDSGAIVRDHIAAFFEHESKTKKFPFGHMFWAAVSSKFDFTGLCPFLDTDELDWYVPLEDLMGSVYTAIAHRTMSPDAFGLRAQLFGLKPSQLFRAADTCVWKANRQNKYIGASSWISPIVAALANLFFEHDVAHAVFTNMSSVKQGEALFTNIRNLKTNTQEEFDALDDYILKKEFESNSPSSAYEWMFRNFHIYRTDMYREDTEFLKAVDTRIGVPPHRSHYVGRDAAFFRDEKEWHEAKHSVAEEWIMSALPYVLFKQVLDEYRRLSREYVDWPGRSSD